MGILLVLLSSTSGCSLLFMKRAPERIVTPQSYVDCTTSVAAPVLDSVCGGYFVLNGVGWAAANCQGDSSCESTQTAGVLLSVGLLALCGGSAISGFSEASRCEQLRGAGDLCRDGNADACLSLNPSWQPRAFPPAQPATRAVDVARYCKPVDPEVEKLRPAGYVSPEEKDCIPLPRTEIRRPESREGCTKDIECKGDRVCEDGRCVSPSVPQAPSDPPPAASRKPVTPRM